MLTFADTFKSIFGWWATVRRSTTTAQQSQPGEAAQHEGSALVAESDEELAFLASIGGLSFEEHEQRITRRTWYRQLVERQALIEAEHQAQQDWWG